MPEPAVSAVQSTGSAAESMQGTLLYAPRSWFQLLVRRLSLEDRLALFRTSRRLCRQVVHSSPSATLRLHGQAQKENRSKLAARQRVIADLLEGCLNLKVVLHRDIEQPFPTALGGVIKELTLQVGGQTCSPACINWGALQRLHTLTFRRTASAEDVRSLCEALEDGQLPCLRTLTWGPYRSAECFFEGMVMECGQEEERQQAAPKLLQRLAAALGKQIVHLGASEEVLTHVSQFTHLQTVTLLRHRIEAATAQQLCEHPTLRHVTFSSESDEYEHWQPMTWFEVEGNHSQCSCKWETVTLLSVKPRVLAALPLAGLKEIRFQYRLTGLDTEDNAAVLDARKHGVQLVCAPHDVHEKGIFHVRDLCREHLALLLSLQGAHTVYLILSDTAAPALLPSAYAQLSKQVARIAIKNEFFSWVSRAERLGLDKSHVWHQLPTTVTHVQIIDFRITDFTDQLGTLARLVLEAPGHVKRLDFVNLRGIREGAVVDYLRAYAPSHLRVSIEPWR